MNGYSEDLRRRIVSAVERGMSKCQASRTFDVSLSSVKRYVKKKPTTENPWPRRRAPDLLRSRTSRPEGSLPPISRNVPTPPFRSAATTWRPCVGALGKSLYHVPRDSPDWIEQEKGGRSATERDEFDRAAWRVMVAAAVEPERLLFVDECGAHTSLAPIYGYAPRGERLYLRPCRETRARTRPYSRV